MIGLVADVTIAIAATVAAVALVVIACVASSVLTSIEGELGVNAKKGDKGDKWSSRKDSLPPAFSHYKIGYAHPPKKGGKNGKPHSSRSTRW